MQVQALVEYLDDYLGAREFRDYAPNGLQVEGKQEVRRIVLGVSASLGLIEAASADGADAVLVHHGWFWKGEDPRIVGTKGARIRRLMAAQLNLIAYHLPLDAHPEVGNNAQLAHRLGLTIEQRAGEYGLLHVGTIQSGAMPASDFADRVERVLGRKPLLVGDSQKSVHRIGWCSGAAQDELRHAVELGCDLFLSGEIREHTTFEAVESGVPYVAAGHTATEQFGIQALGEKIAAEFPELSVGFVAQENPV